MKTSFDAIAPTPAKGFNEVRKHFDLLTSDTKTKFKGSTRIFNEDCI